MFPRTSWSTIEALKDATQRDAALSLLSERYREPLVIYATRYFKNYPIGDREPEDAVQAFFVHLIQTALLEKPVKDENRRFRNWLLTAFKYFLNNDTRTERNRSITRASSLENKAQHSTSAESAQMDSSHLSTAELEFEQRWAVDLFEKAKDLFRQRYSAEPDYIIYISKIQDRATIDALCKSHGKSKSQIETILKRMAGGFHTILDNLLEIELEYPDPTEIAVEKRRLFELLRDAHSGF